MDFSKRLNEVMKSRGISQYRLSKISGITQSTLNGILIGKVKSPNMDTVEKIAKALNMSISELIGENDKKSSEENVVANLKLLVGEMSAKEFAAKINNPGITDEMIEFYLSSELVPSIGSLCIIAEAIGIDYNFFYNENTPESLEQAKADYLTSQDGANEISVSDKEMKLIRKIRDNGLNIDLVDNMLDIMIAQKKN